MFRTMKQNIFLKSTIRQPLRSLFLFLLIGLMSFAFIAKAVEYLVVQREVQRLGGYYRSIGQLYNIEDPSLGDIAPGIALIENSSLIDNQDYRTYSQAVMQGLYNAEDDFGFSDSNVIPQFNIGLHNRDMWFYGELKARREITQTLETGEKKLLGYSLGFFVDTVLAGYPNMVKAESFVSFLFFFEEHEDAIPIIEAMELGQRYLIRGWSDKYFSLTGFLIIHPDYQGINSTYEIRPLDDEDLWYLPIEQDQDLDFTDPALVELKNQIDKLNENQHALFAVGTEDMSAMPEMQTSAQWYYLVEGRWLNNQDNLDKNKEIVVHVNLAQSAGLKLGDTITFTLRYLQDPYYCYILPGIDAQNWRTYPTHEETYEIVGIFSDPVSDHKGGTNASLYAYVPASTLPDNVTYAKDLYETSRLSSDFGLKKNVSPSESYSFVLKSSQDQNSFISQYEADLEQLGISLSFVENNGPQFWASVDPLSRYATNGALIFAVVLVLAMALIVFLYFLQRRRDYAILRAMGLAKRRANGQMMLPILLVGALGIITGGAISWRFALERALDSISGIPLPSGEVASADLNPVYLVVLCVGIFLMLLLFAWLGTHHLARKPVLEILQGVSNPKTRRKRWSNPGFVNASSAPLDNAVNDPVQNSIPHGDVQQPMRRIWGPGIARFGALVQYTFRQIGRSWVKTLLIVFVASGFILAQGWMLWTIENNQDQIERLYTNTVVEMEILPRNLSISLVSADGIIGDIPKQVVDSVLETGLTQNFYLEGSVLVNGYSNDLVTDAEGFEIVAFNNPERYFDLYYKWVDVNYLEGYSQDIFDKTWDSKELRGNFAIPAIFPETILSEYDLHLRDTISVIDGFQQIRKILVVGSFAAETKLYNEGGLPILMPISILEGLYGSVMRYQTAQFEIDPARNQEIPEFREEIEKMLKDSTIGNISLRVVFYDEELRTVIAPLEKSLSLLQMLYPIMVAVAVLIGAGLSLLISLQKAKRAALLRILGVSKSGVCAMFICEGLFTALLGEALGMGALTLLGKNPDTFFSGSIVISALLYLIGALGGALLGAIIISNKKPMELLQVKE